MSQLLNGSEQPSEHSFTFGVTDSSHVGEVRRFALALATCLEFNTTQEGRVGIVVNELANNLAKYGKDGFMHVRIRKEVNFPSIEIISADSGPGIDNVNLSLEDGFTTGTTPGTGLGAVKRQSNQFDMYSMASKGTVIVSVIHGVEPEDEPLKDTDAISAICIPYPGETISGDAWSVKVLEDNTIRIFMADGLGHGVYANEAAREAISTFDENVSDTPERLVSAVHGRLRATRGAAVMEVILNTSTRQTIFCGVGNIRSVLWAPEKTKNLISQNGTAGLQIRSLRAMTEAWPNHSVCITHSDGINNRWDLSAYPGLYRRHPALIAATIIRDSKRGTDDATVVVVRHSND